MPVIKRYSNRKLYDTESRRYVTLEDLAGAIRRGEEVRVVDHVTGEDLTTLTLFQVIIEEEKKIGGLLPQVALAGLIRAGSVKVSALRSRLVAFDPFQVVDEEIRRRVSRLVRGGVWGAEEGQRITDLLTGRAALEEEQPPVEEPAPPAPPAGDDATVEYATLLSKVEALEKELERLKEQQ